MTSEALTIRSLTAIPVSVPMRRPLGTSAQTIEKAPLLLLTLSTNEGISGNAYAFCYLDSVAKSLTSIVADLSKHLQNHTVAPVELANSVSRYFRLTGLYGPLCMVASAIDSAAWDALARSVSLPLVTMLGGTGKRVRAYNSNGLGLMEPARAADEAEELIAEGFSAVKLRLGRQSFSDDLAAVRAVRKRLPADARLMVDFNQALSFSAAMEFCPQLDDEGVYWIEEPIRHDDFCHAAMVAHATRTPIQLGENLVGVQPLLGALQGNASDLLMFDVDRIGGVTGWRSAAGLALAAGRQVSSHLFPEISAHLLAATPGAHWLEYVDWASPLLETPLQIEDGMAVLGDLPGNGIRWDQERVRAYQLV
ncbi:enolase C-terminal domain-like protein [Burkholderia cenocepacia]|uniref:enolase C-terminal domain-like protein n=1 Tax=Burkholderia cenocepacia TaxID=95486 RepID=UPI00285F29AC|nr:enolase C-terminal domain-like protein [Burkholderia cenocepacia]MDR5644416.1 mandelate racemase [Burkholderia cenocepacia]